MDTARHRIVVFTGAGTSAEAGLPTFRNSESGLWNNHDVQQVCSMKTFHSNKDLVRNFYNDLRKQIQKASPTSVHERVRDWQDSVFQDFEVKVVTQNVDDLFERAGVKDVLHVHGDIRFDRCLIDRTKHYIGFDDSKESTKCSTCGKNNMKPDVVFFGEYCEAYQPAIDLLRSLGTDDYLVVLGTSGSVFPLEKFVRFKPSTKFLNVLSPKECLFNLDTFHHTFFEPCTTALPKIESLINQTKSDL